VPPVDDADAVGRGRERVRLLPGERHCEDRRDPADRQQARERDHDTSAAELPGGCDRLALAPRSLERRVVLQDHALKLLQLRARLDAQLVHEPPTRGAIGLERLGLASAAVEGDEPQALEALTQRVLAGQRLELDDHLRVPPQGEVGLDAVLERGEAHFLEPPDLVLREGLVGEVGQRRSAPERECLLEPRRRSGRLLVAGLLDEGLEARRVERVDPQGVAGRLSNQCAVAEHPSQPRDVALNVLRRGRRRPLSPELVDEPVDRDDLAGAQEQDREQGARLAGRKLERPVVARDLERAQDAELERPAHARSTGVNRSSTAAAEGLSRRESRARTGQA
jgi:hypothetical protein